MSEVPQRDDVARKQRRDLIILWAYFIVWTSIALGFFYIFAIRASSLFGGLISGSMVLLGLFWIWHMARATANEAKFGVVSLTPARRPACPGGRLEAILRFHDQLPGFAEIEAELRCVAVTIIKRSQTGVAPHEQIAWSTRKTFPLHRDRADIGFDIPADAPATDLPGERASESGWHSLAMEPGKALRFHRWELFVTARAPGLDLERGFPVVIDPRVKSTAAGVKKAMPNYVPIPKGLGKIPSIVIGMAILGYFFSDTISDAIRSDEVAKQIAAALTAAGLTPPVVTREQGFDMAKAGYERSFPDFAGEPQPAAYFEGVWRRQGRLYHSDLRRLEVRRNGDEMQVRIWHECNPGGAPCAAGEVAAQVARSADGLIASLAATVEIPEGRLWMRMARGRKQDDSAVIVTQVYLRERPEWQVSSGGAVELWREKLPVPVADFLGDWARSFPGEIGDFTRLSLRETAPGSHAMRAWARCEEKRECDLGEAPLQVEVEAETGLVRAVRSRFSSKGRELLVSLEPPRQGRSFAVTENSEITFETVVVPQGRSSSRSVVREKGRSTATRRIALHRGHPAEPFAAVVAAGPLGVAPVAEGGPVREDCAGIDDLHLAVMRDCIDRQGSLKAGLEQRNRLGQTPLALAVLQNKPVMVKSLLAQGADINAPIRFGEGEWPVSSGLQRAQRPELAAGSTPLIMARDAAMVSLLLQAGADMNVKNGYGWSAVFYYTHHGSVEMLDTLLAAGADINATADVDPSHRGTTALMWAAYMNRTAHLQTLLKYQPKRDVRDAAGKTALDYAKGFGHAEAVRLLNTPGP
jgi:hypothetical protein